MGAVFAVAWLWAVLLLFLWRTIREDSWPSVQKALCTRARFQY